VHFVKGENIPAAEVPESFKVLVKEMKSLCLDVELIGEAREESLEDFVPEEPESLAAALMTQDFDSDEDALDLIASGLDSLGIDALDNSPDGFNDGESLDTTGTLFADGNGSGLSSKSEPLKDEDLTVQQIKQLIDMTDDEETATDTTDADGEGKE
jgi:hypothetical protein